MRPRRATLAIACCVTLAAVGPQTSAAAAHVLAPRTYRPTGHWCPTNRTCFSRVTWIHYTATSAEGYGPAKDCAGGGLGCHSYPRLRVYLDAPRRACGATRFSQLHLFGRTLGLESLVCSVYE